MKMYKIIEFVEMVQSNRVYDSLSLSLFNLRQICNAKTSFISYLTTRLILLKQNISYRLTVSEFLVRLSVESFTDNIMLVRVETNLHWANILNFLIKNENLWIPSSHMWIIFLLINSHLWLYITSNILKFNNMLKF